MINFLSLFSGIGGFELGLERTGGFECVCQVEIDKFCLKVLAKHWPDVPKFTDVKEFGQAEIDSLPKIDMICGGFPCQDISVAGKGVGLEGERSGLFYEILRIAAICHPRWIFLENVSALLVRGLNAVLREISKIGFDATWHCIPASYFGSPHRRDRA